MEATEQFYINLLGLDIPRIKALSNLVGSLASNTVADSVVKLSLSPIYHFQYSSITDAISHLYADDLKAQGMKATMETVEKKLYPFLQVKFQRTIKISIF